MFRLFWMGRRWWRLTFTIDEAGFVRMLVRARSDTGPQRLGRITQRLIEIETYKCMAMLTLPVARKVGGTLAEVDTRLAGIVGGFAEAGDTGKERFDELGRAVGADRGYFRAVGEPVFGGAGLWGDR